MIITKDFYSLIEMNKYIEDNNIKSKDVYYMGNFLNIQGYCMFPIPGNQSPRYSLQYEDEIKSSVSCVFN